MCFISYARKYGSTVYAAVDSPPEFKTCTGARNVWVSFNEGGLYVGQGKVFGLQEVMSNSPLDMGPFSYMFVKSPATTWSITVCKEAKGRLHIVI